MGGKKPGDDTHAGIPVTDHNAPRGPNLEERARQHNSNLQRLIEAVGGLLSASGDLLARLHQILGSQPAGGAPGPTNCGGNDKPDPDIQ